MNIMMGFRLQAVMMNILSKKKKKKAVMNVCHGPTYGYQIMSANIIHFHAKTDLEQHTISESG